MKLFGTIKGIQLISESKEEHTTTATFRSGNMTIRAQANRPSEAAIKRAGVLLNKIAESNLKKA
ncbi:hypothetical protein [Paenibacillus sp. tmac-D7]|uniref:hypothetical protein n=1 Tax=Paenibacillus sp. tmac-D7 TaxID=2591462 RepID=UPI001144F566|nr:hypothetical protein [Paenibacillus sp. tmac-D7]